MAGSGRWVIRDGRDTDGPDLIALIWSCWSIYPGVRMDVDREMPELHALATYYAGQAGALWVAEADGRIVGMTAVRRLANAAAEICRVYVEPAWHGCGLGHDLLNRAEAFAISAGVDRLLLWSDTRFDRAHGFYEKRSYVRNGPIRVLNDISNSLEFGYAKPVNGVEPLDIAAARSAAGRLSDILIACVDEGASVSFLAPLAPDKARAFWHRAATEVGTAQRVIVAAWRNGVLSGVGMLNLATPEDQQHRADVQKVLVHPLNRRGGLGRQIMRALQHVAAMHGRSLLTLDTSTGGAGEALCRSECWQEAGQVPDFARDATGAARAVGIFWKRIT